MWHKHKPRKWNDVDLDPLDFRRNHDKDRVFAQTPRELMPPPTVFRGFPSAGWANNAVVHAEFHPTNDEIGAKGHSIEDYKVLKNAVTPPVEKHLPVFGNLSSIWW